MAEAAAAELLAAPPCDLDLAHRLAAVIGTMREGSRFNLEQWLDRAEKGYGGVAQLYAPSAQHKRTNPECELASEGYPRAL